MIEVILMINMSSKEENMTSKYQVHITVRLDFNMHRLRVVSTLKNIQINLKNIKTNKTIYYHQLFFLKSNKVSVPINN